jgi:PAS domain S-box-containing protein
MVKKKSKAHKNIDSTEPKQVEKSKIEGDEKYRLLFETMALGVVYQDVKGKIISANPAAERILGLTLDEMTGRTSVDPRWKSIHRDGSDFRGETHPAMVALKTGKPVNDVIMGVFHPQHEEHRWININAVPQYKPGEKTPYQVYATFADITELIQAEEALIETEQRFRSMIEQTTDAVFCYEFDPPIPTHLPVEDQVRLMYNCTLAECNDVCAKSYGDYKPEDVIGRKLTDLFGTTSSSLDSLFGAMVQGGYQIIDGEAVEVLEDGTERYFLNNGHGVIHDGQLLRIWGTFRDITDRKLTEKALRESEVRYQTMFESAPDAIYLNDLKGIFIDGNKVAEKLVGYDKEELIGKNMLKVNLLPKSQIPKAAKQLALSTMGKPTGPTEFTINRKDGTQVQVEISTFPVKLLDQNVVLSIARDITTRKQAEEALKESEEKFRNIIEASPMGMHMYQLEPDDSLVFIGANPAADTILGIDNSQFIGKTIEEAFPPLAESEVPKRYRAAAAEGTPWYTEQINYQDDQIAGAFEVYSFQTSPGKMTALFLDITERKQAEEALKESEEKFRNIVESSPMGMHMYQLEPDGSLVFVGANPAADTILGIDNSQFIGKTQEEAFPSSVGTELPQRYRAAAAEGTPWYSEQINYQDDQIAGAFEVYAFQTSPGKMTALFLEITERKQTEEQLKMLSLAVEQSTNSIAIMDPLGRIEYLNTTASEVSGYPLEKVIGKHWRASISRRSSLRGKLREIQNTVLREGNVWSGEVTDRAEDGSEIWRHVRVLPIKDEIGEIIHTVYTSEDITERKQAEEEIRRLNEELEQRVIDRTTELKATNEELEAFAYSISHDLRAPLRAINGFSSILKENYADVLDDEGQNYLDKLKSSTLRMDGLINDLLSLSRLGRKELDFQPMKITPMVSMILADLTNEDPDREFELHVADCPSVNADKQLMEVMLTNLLSNAVKFTRGRQPAVIEFGYQTEADQPTFYLRDNGVGFNMEYADKLFSPFQRLHGVEEFEGTGIGLAIVRRILQRHGGSVWVEAELDKGATIYFTL